MNVFVQDGIFAAITIWCKRRNAYWYEYSNESGKRWFVMQIRLLETPVTQCISGFYRMTVRCKVVSMEWTVDGKDKNITAKFGYTSFSKILNDSIRYVLLFMQKLKYDNNNNFEYAYASNCNQSSSHYNLWARISMKENLLSWPLPCSFPPHTLSPPNKVSLRSDASPRGTSDFSPTILPTNCRFANRYTSHSNLHQSHTSPPSLLGSSSPPVHLVLQKIVVKPHIFYLHVCPQCTLEHLNVGHNFPSQEYVSDMGC